MWDPNKYIVFKTEDVEKFGTQWYFRVFTWLAARISKGRMKAGKPTLNQYLVINLNDANISNVVSMLKDSGWSIDGIPVK